MMLPFEDPRRRCLKIDEWPEADRGAWERALRKDHVLGDPAYAVTEIYMVDTSSSR